MLYEGTVIRPPSEANSIILQVTLGCSHNKCTFCGAYKDKLFQIKTDSLINHDIDFAARHCLRQKRVFLADGDALINPHKKLVSIFGRIRKKLPHVNRISLYANAKSIRLKTIAQLQELKKLGLHRVYLGLESGHDDILESVCKGETGQTMIEAAEKINLAKLFLSVTVLLGIGGKQLSSEHAKRTAQVLNKMKPRQVAALTLMVLEDTPLGLKARKGSFILPDKKQLLEELQRLVSELNLERCQFHANHASNYLPLEGRLPRDKQFLLNTIKQAISGQTELKPESMRAL